MAVKMNDATLKVQLNVLADEITNRLIYLVGFPSNLKLLHSQEMN